MIRQLLFDIKNYLTSNDNSEAAKALIGRIDAEQKYFIVTRLHRDDILAQGVDASQMDDDDMVELASKMANDYCEQLFHLQIPIICDGMNIPFFKCPNCERDAAQCGNDGDCYCKSCHHEWNIHRIPECYEGTYVLVEHPEDASHFENDGIGYPSFNSEDNGARYVSIEDYFGHIKKLPAKSTVYVIKIWPDSQNFFELPDNLRGLCEDIESGKAFEDFGSSAIWAPLCLIKNEAEQQ